MPGLRFDLDQWDGFLRHHVIACCILVRCLNASIRCLRRLGRRFDIDQNRYRTMRRGRAPNASPEATAIAAGRAGNVGRRFGFTAP